MPNKILDKQTAEKKLHRIALEIAERNYEKNEIVLIGIKESGVVVAKKIREYLETVFTGDIVLYELSINKRSPGKITINDEPDLRGKVVILVDDVANTGRTMLYALQPLIQLYPQKIETLALVERSHKLFPIAVDYVGSSISTTPEENIVVEVSAGEISGAWLNDSSSQINPK